MARTGLYGSPDSKDAPLGNCAKAIATSWGTAATIKFVGLGGKPHSDNGKSWNLKHPGT